MPKVKKMDEGGFSKLHRDVTTTVEIIRARQDEKQSLINDFLSESKRFYFGKISEKSLMNSVKKTNNEFDRLDKEIRNAMQRIRSLTDRELKMVSKQAPTKYQASLSGIYLKGAKKKSTSKKSSSKKSTSKKSSSSKKTTKKSPTKKKTTKKAPKKSSKKKK